MAVLALSGCGAQEDVSFTCGPEEEPRECGWWEARRANAAFEEVEDRYMITREDTDAALMNPSSEHEWKKVNKYSIDPYLSAARNIAKSFKESGQRLDGVVPVTQVDRVSYTDEVAQIAICSDARRVPARDLETNEIVSYGDVTRLHIKAVKRNGQWLIASAENVDIGPCE